MSETSESDCRRRPAKKRAVDLLKRLIDELVSCEDESETTASESDVSSYYNKEEMEYYMSLSKRKRADVDKLENSLVSPEYERVPMRFRVLLSQMPKQAKSVAIRKINALAEMEPGYGEYSKMRNWLEALCRLPLGKTERLPVDVADPSSVSAFLSKIRARLNDDVFGHVDAKHHILMTLAKWIVNPSAPGVVLGLCGPPGVGKTTLAKDGVAKALGLPFAFVPLGGANDSSFLDGHSYTYEGSTWGRIADVLMHAGCANPVVCFDELDKVRDNSRGDEIYNVLIHITDPSQNKNFQDKYFSEIEIDLSKCIMIFTFNDEAKIHPILKDRMIMIKTNDYSPAEKLSIANDFILPRSLATYGMTKEDVVITNEVMESIISSSGDSMRDVTRNIEEIIGNINVHRLLPDSDMPNPVPFPCVLSQKVASKIINRGTKRGRSGPPPGMYI
jgi:ATP-dependent Lon protease